MKRLLDILFSIGLLALTWPIFLIVAIMVRTYLGSPVFFKQLRPGFQGKPFMLLKFRTMSGDTDDQGQLLRDFERLKPLGRFLRYLSLDELPQLLNVLKGDMSLVGPRPLLMEYVPLYTPFQSRRHEVKPGITGWAQVNGRNAINWEEKFALDVWYVDNFSFWLDIKILWMTLIKVFKSEGISQQGYATMEKFRGINS